jgi:tripartite-type tricarboxylate transporter receptor subunit TctC
MNRRSVLKAGAGLAAALSLPGARAQSAGYPNRPIRIIVPYAAGLSPDVVARLLGDRLGQAIGQPVLVDNRPGAGGMIGAEIAAAAPADGYNLFFTVKGVMAIAPHVYPSAKYNPLKDFKSITEILIVPHIITATPGAPYNTLKELVEYAKKNPGRIDYASAGVGSQPHVALETLAQRLGIKLVHVPYKTNPAPDVMSGVVSLSLEASTTAIPSIKAGKIKALATSGNERIPSLPDLPTLTEFGSNLDPNGVIGNSWHGVFTPAGTPDDIVARLNTEIVRIVKSADMQSRLRALGLTPTGTPAATLTANVASDYAYWGNLVRELGVKVE